jgi:protein tyrosine phosphatase
VRIIQLDKLKGTRPQEISEASQEKENIKKNRYPDVLPYEKTRVKLENRVRVFFLLGILQQV